MMDENLVFVVIMAVAVALFVWGISIGWDAAKNDLMEDYACVIVKDEPLVKESGKILVLERLECNGFQVEVLEYD